MSLLRVSAKVFLIPLIYSKVIQNDEISIAQLLTFEFRVFFARNFLEVSNHSLK